MIASSRPGSSLPARLPFSSTGCCAAGRPGYGLPLQTLALLGFGAAAGAALMITPELGAYLVAAGLLGHAAWDVHHHRVNRVVVRSLAEYCLALDTALAVAIVIVTVLQ
jgi:hypothetical protein